MIIMMTTMMMMMMTMTKMMIDRQDDERPLQKHLRHRSRSENENSVVRVKTIKCKF